MSEEQKAAVARWVGEGASVADVQKRLGEEYSLRPTYMDVRFLIDDLELTLADKPAPKEPPPAPPPADSGAKTAGHDGTMHSDTAETELIDDGAAPGGGGKVAVTIDKITKPGSLVSGAVTFGDGNKAQWFLDQMGRLALNPSTPGYKPSQADVMAFQRELQSIIEQQGGMF
ncbi:MAG: hypothetical protein JJU00_10940 [Opitutales bacterium]|nr:hypothetical protein [Opitutales bacterium]